jgi:hypothetical protein
LIIDKPLAEIDDIKIGKVEKISCNARRRLENPIPRFGHSPAFADDQEARIVSKSILRVSLSVVPKKRALLDEIEKVSGNSSRHLWDHRILTRHQYDIASGTGYPQEYSPEKERLQSVIKGGKVMKGGKLDRNRRS